MLRTKRNPSKPPTQRQFDRMVMKHRAEIENICNRLAAGELSPQQWADEFYKILVSGHSQAWMLGRQLGGDLRAMDDLDRTLGQAKADLESQYINDFEKALLSPGRAARDGGLFDEAGNLKTSKVISRAQSYTGKMRSSAAESFVNAGDEGELYDWVLGGTEEHCDECPLWADMGPYHKDSLPLYPGDGSTPCKGNCLCTLVRHSDGRALFGPVR